MSKTNKLGIMTLFLLVLVLIFMGSVSADITAHDFNFGTENQIGNTIYTADTSLSLRVFLASDNSSDFPISCSLNLSNSDYDVTDNFVLSENNTFVDRTYDFSGLSAGIYDFDSHNCTPQSNPSNILDLSAYTLIFDDVKPTWEHPSLTSLNISDQVIFTINDTLSGVDESSVVVIFSDSVTYANYLVSTVNCNELDSSGNFTCSFTVPAMPESTYNILIEVNDTVLNTLTDSVENITVNKIVLSSDDLIITSPLNHTALSEGNRNFVFSITNNPFSTYNCTFEINDSALPDEDTFNSNSGSFSYESDFGVFLWNISCYSDTYTLQSQNYIVAFENETIDVQTSQTYSTLEDGLQNYVSFDYLDSGNFGDLFSSSEFTPSNVGLSSRANFGQVVVFNSDTATDILDAATPIILDESAFTLSLWFNPLTNNESYLLSSANGAFSVGITDTGLIVNITNATTNSIFVPVSLVNLWNHLALTYNGSDLLIFLDGDLISSTDIGLISSTLANRQIKFIGGNSTTTPFNGSIDELLVYNRVLNPFDINILSGTQVLYDTTMHGDRVFLTVLPTNAYWPTLNCSLYVNNTLEESADVEDNTRYTFVYDILTDDNFDWYVSCDDTYLSDSSSTSSVTVDYTPSAPLLVPHNASTNNQTIDIIGALGVKADLTLTSLVQAYFGTQTNTSSTIQNYSTYIGGGLVTHYINPYVFRVNRTNLDPGVDAYLSILDSGYVALDVDILNLFANANSFSPNLEFLKIINVTPFQGTFVIELEQNSLLTLTPGDSVEFFTGPKPLGWFNASFELLSGLNEMSIEANIGTYVGPFSGFNIYFDDILPQLFRNNWLSAIGKPWSLGFNITDDYALDNSSVYAIINDSLSSTTFNVSNSAEIICNSNDINATCTLFVPSSLTSGLYNITLFAKDGAGNLGNSSTQEMYVRSELSAVSEINDTGSNVTTANIFVNWNLIPDDYVAYYNLSVTTVPGKANIINWTTVSNDTTNYTFDDEILKSYYGDYLFVEIYPVDIAGVTGPITSTDGIWLVDQTPPVKNNVSIIGDRGAWVRSDSQLHLYFNFTDNETGIAQYTYIVGTKPWPSDSDSSSVIGETSTTQNDFVVTGLSLTEGASYYVSAKAWNDCPNCSSESPGFISSAAIRVDSVEPFGGWISYLPGPTSLSSALINYDTGDDVTSGYQKTTIMQKTSPLINGQCGFFTGDYEPVTSFFGKGIGSHSVTLENGLCYVFALYIYDNAGNVNLIEGSTTNNISVDQTAPSIVDITIDDGHLTPDTEISASWTNSIDLESGIDYYQYALGNSSNPNDVNEVIDWTNISYINTSLIMKDLNLSHLTTYYFKIKAFNHHGLSSTAVSNPVTYVDLIVPDHLIVTSVGNDISSPWIDNSLTDNSTINLTGEKGLSCVWSYYDIEYINPTPAFNYTHACGFDGQGNYFCNITKPDGVSALEEGIYTVHVSCRDLAGNIQRSNTNTDVTFAKDLGAPLVTVSGLVPDGLYNQNPIYINIQEATLDAAYYEVYAGINLVGSDYLIIGNNSISNLPINSEIAEHRLVVFANDSFNQTNATTDITFFVNSSIPAGSIYSPTEYINKDTNLTLSLSFFNNYSYSIVGTGSITGDYTYNNSNMSNVTTFERVDLQINISEFEDGDYTLTLEVNNSDNGTVRTNVTSFDFVVDTAIPEYSDANDPGIVYDNESINLYITSSEENVSVIFNGTNYPAFPVSFGELVAPEGSNRFWVQIQPTHVNDPMDYLWIIYDLAGNNETIPGSVFVNNRKTTFDDNITGILDFANKDWSWDFDFSDEDITQKYTDFNCSLDKNGSFILINSPYSCVIEWDDASPGYYELNITVNESSDGLFVDSINRTVYVNFTDTANTTLILDTAYIVQGVIYDNVHLVAPQSIESSKYTTMSRYGNNLTGLASIDYSRSSVILTIDDIGLSIDNVTGGDVGNLSFKKKTLATTTYAPQDLGLSYRYVPVHSYAINLSYPFDTFNFLTFDVSDYDMSNIILYRYDFDFDMNVVNYSSNQTVSIHFSDNETAIYDILGMQGLFVLVEDVCTPPSSMVDGICIPPEPAVIPPPVSHSSSSSSGGFSMPAPVEVVEENITNETEKEPVEIIQPVASCFDSIQNQGEEDVDCGGPCSACVIETASKTEDETNSREESPDLFADANDKKTNSSKRSFPWWTLIVLVVIGAGAGAGVIVSRKPEASIIQQVIDSSEAKDVIDVTKFIQMHALQNNHVQDNELLGMGFVQSRIDLARYALANDAMVNSVMQYLEQNTSKGYTADELCNWLVSKDVHEGVVLLAKERFVLPSTVQSIENSSILNNSPDLDSNKLN